MAQRRMISRTIIESDDFLDLSTDAKALYMYCVCSADDRGFFTGAKGLMLLTQTNGSITELVQSGFVELSDESRKVYRVARWETFNKVQPSKMIESEYVDLIEVGQKSDKGRTNADNSPRSTVKCSLNSTVKCSLNSSVQNSVDNLEQSNEIIDTTTDFTDDQLKTDFDCFSSYCSEQCFPLSAINPRSLFDKLSRLAWKTKQGKPITDVKQYLEYCYNLACEKNPDVESERQQMIKHRKQAAERKAEEERRQKEEDEKYWQNDTYFASGKEFTEYLRGQKWTKYDEDLAHNLFWMSEYLETENGFEHDDNAFTELELLEMFDSGIIQVDMQTGIKELFHEPDIETCQNDALVAKIRKNQASIKPAPRISEPQTTPEESEPEKLPFIDYRTDDKEPKEPTTNIPWQ